MSKRLSSPLPTRDSAAADWLKFPIRPTGSYVVGGFRHETGSTHRLGAVLVGEPTADGLVFRGRVGSGIGGQGRPAARPSCSARWSAADSPFADEVPAAGHVGTVWVEPEIVVDVQYLGPHHRRPAPAAGVPGVRTDLHPRT